MNYMRNSKILWRKSSQCKIHVECVYSFLVCNKTWKKSCRSWWKLCVAIFLSSLFKTIYYWMIEWRTPCIIILFSRSRRFERHLHFWNLHFHFHVSSTFGQRDALKIGGCRNNVNETQKLQYLMIVIMLTRIWM